MQRRRNSHALVASASMGALLAAVVALAAETGPPAMLDALLDERHTLPLSDLVDRVQLADDEAFRVAEFGRDAHSSHHVVAIRDREVPHRHDRHDLFVVMVRGHGFMRLGDEERAVGEHSVLYVPRGTPHAFRNVTDAPAIAYAVYSPAFDGKDRVIVE